MSVMTDETRAKLRAFPWEAHELVAGADFKTDVEEDRDEKLWHVLSAMRGPDEKGFLMLRKCPIHANTQAGRAKLDACNYGGANLKAATTEVLRALALPRLARFSAVAGRLEPGVQNRRIEFDLTAAEKRSALEVSQHFIEHVRKAAKALGVVFNSEKPYPDEAAPAAPAAPEPAGTE